MVHDTVAVKPTKYTHMFIGRSPMNDMTKFSYGYGPKFDGNSMLFELAPGRYMFIGECIRVFSTRSPITTFVSPVGNNDVPYPFAVNRSGTVYLLIEGVQLTAGPYTNDVLQDPYTFYYDRSLLTPGKGQRWDVVEDEFTNLYIGSTQITFKYSPNPEQEFERLSHIGRDKTQEKPMYVVTHDEKKKLSKEDYVGIMRRIGKQRGFAPFKSKVLVPRLWY